MNGFVFIYCISPSHMIIWMLAQFGDFLQETQGWNTLLGQMCAGEQAVPKESLSATRANYCAVL